MSESHFVWRLFAISLTAGDSNSEHKKKEETRYELVRYMIIWFPPKKVVMSARQTEALTASVNTSVRLGFISSKGVQARNDVWKEMLTIAWRFFDDILYELTHFTHSQFFNA
jgi:hypothetical protein